MEGTSTLDLIASSDEPASSGNVEVLWHQPGEGIHTDIWAEDDLVFAPRFDGSIEIIDAASGRILGEAVASGIAFDVKSRGGILHVATSSAGLQVFDVSDPADPRLIGGFEIPGPGGEPRSTSFHNIFLSPDGRFVYAIHDTEAPVTELLIIDVADPSTPELAGRFSLEGAAERGFQFTHDVHVIESGGRLTAYLSYQLAGLWILDVTDPADISVLGSAEWDGIVSHSGWAFSDGDALYYAHTSEGYDLHLTVLDVTDPADPRIVSRFATRKGLSIHNVQVERGIAYISYYIDGLRVVDLRNPETPGQIAHFDTVPDERERSILQGAWGVMVLDGRVYVSDIETGIYALRVTVD